MTVDPKAIAKAESRLRVAHDAMQDMRTCNLKEVADRWYVFLVASKNVYTALKAGVKASPQSRQWFGAKTQERKDDDLLQYLFQARDDDEHGLEQVSEVVPDNIRLGTPEPGKHSMSVRVTRVSANEMLIESLDGLPVAYDHEPAHVRLAPVTGRGPVTYQPPMTHKGQPIQDCSPVSVAELALAHLSALIEEARTLA